MEYSCHALTSAPRCYLDMLDKLQKRLCRTDGPSLVADLETLAHHPNVASLILFYRHYFGRCFSELAEVVPLPHSNKKCQLVIPIHFTVILSQFLDVIRMSLSRVLSL